MVFLFHFSPSAVSCSQVWNRLREEAKLSFDIWERGDGAAVKSTLDFFNLHTHSPINSQVWKVFNEKYPCKSQAFIKAHNRLEVQVKGTLQDATSGFPVNHQLLEFTQTHVHRVSDAIQPSHSLSSPSPPAFNLSQHPSEPVLRIRWPKYWSFSISPSSHFLSGLTGWISCSPRESQESSPTPQFKGTQLSYIHTWLLEKP